VCFEEDFNFCHRSFVAERLELFTASLRIKHPAGPIQGRVVRVQAQAVAWDIPIPSPWLSRLLTPSALPGSRRQFWSGWLKSNAANLNVIMTLAVLGFVLPNFTTSMSGPRLSWPQEIFLIATSVGLYAIFLLVQTMRHRPHFIAAQDVTVPPDSGHHSTRMRSTAYHSVMLVVYLVAVVLLAEKFAIPFDNGIERLVYPRRLAGRLSPRWSLRRRG
jgi:hypothetical protein